MTQLRSEVKIKLKYPVQFGSETISEIIMKRPKGKHIRRMSGDTDESRALSFAQQMSGQPQEVFDEMEFVDVQEVLSVVQSFLENGPKTGPNSGES